MKPLLSIIIPTKNRYEYLLECVNVLSKIDELAIEIIVQDNSDNNEEFISYLSKLKYKNFKYEYNADNISIIDNCNLAMKHVTGEYVCMLGDDDAVTSSIVDVVKWMKEEDIESCLGGIIRYNWPDMVFSRHNYHSLIIPKVTNSIRKISHKEELSKALNIGARTMNNLPKVYHAIVSKKALDRVYERTNSYFPGPSPDMANAIALSCTLKNHVLIDLPVIISGFSYKSTGGMGARGAHISPISEAKHLPSDTESNWNEKIPKIWTAETIYAESTLKALAALDEVEYLDEFNFIYLYASLVCYNRKVFKFIPPLIKKPSDYIKFVKYFISIMSLRGKNYVINKVQSKLDMSEKTLYSNVNSLSDAYEIAEEFVKNKYSNCEIRGFDK